jgi:hypothetical protein
VITVESLLICPLVDQKKTLRIVGRSKVVVADAAFNGTDAVSYTALLHFLDILTCSAVLTGISDVNHELSVAIQ